MISSNDLKERLIAAAYNGSSNRVCIFIEHGTAKVQDTYGKIKVSKKNLEITLNSLEIAQFCVVEKHHQGYYEVAVLDFDF